MIFLEKAKDKKRLLESIADITLLAEIAQVLNFINLRERYIWIMSNANLNAIKELKLTGIQKY